ncbi:MAG: thrombospondin type 3 repeat-containing protein [Bryobacterales bacterium]
MTLCFTYDEASFESEHRVRAFQHDGAAWVDRSYSLDATSNSVCARADSLGQFAVFESEGKLKPGDVVVAVQNIPALVAVDSNTGEQTILSWSGEMSRGMVANGSTGLINGVAMEAGGGILVSERLGPGSIIRVNPVTGEQTVLALLTPGSFQDNMGIALDWNGNVLVGNGQANALLRIDRATGAQTTVASGAPLDRPIGIGVGRNGDIFAADNNSRAVMRIDPVTGAITTITTLGIPKGLEVDPAGQLLVSEPGRIVRIDPDTGSIQEVSSGGQFNAVFDLEVAADGTIFAADELAFDVQGGVFKVDPVTGGQTRIASGGYLPGGTRPSGLALVPTPRIYVSNTASGSVSVINGQTNAVEATIPVPGAGALVLSPTASHLYVLAIASAADGVAVIDTTTNLVTTVIPVAPALHAIAVTPDGETLYVTSQDGNVYVIDTMTNVVVSSVNVGGSTEGIAVGSTLQGVRAYVGTLAGVSVIDAANNTVVGSISRPASNRHRAAVSPDGRRAYFADSGRDLLIVVDTASNTVTEEIPVGVDPRGISISADARRAYVINAGDASVSVVNLATNTVESTMTNVAADSRGIAAGLLGDALYLPRPTGGEIEVRDPQSGALITRIGVGDFPRDIVTALIKIYDTDGDGIPDVLDPCPSDPTAGCVPAPDTDGDGLTDDIDPDDDNDGIPDASDPCPLSPLNTCLSDPDNDGIPSSQDPCPSDITNQCSDDIDGDGTANTADEDADGDGKLNSVDPCPFDAGDSCPFLDSDADGVANTLDRCPLDPTDQCNPLLGPGYIHTVIGGGPVDGTTATQYPLLTATGATSDSDGNLYITSGDHRIRYVSGTTGATVVVAGDGNRGFSGDGGPAKNARLDVPRSPVVDSQGNVFFVEVGSKRVRRISAGADGVVDGDSDEIIQTVAGNGSASFPGDGALAVNAGMSPIAITMDAAGHLYIADTFRVFKVDPGSDGIINRGSDEVIVTVAGTGSPGSNGDGGPANSAQLAPRSLRFDPSGNLFAIDSVTYKVRRISAGADGLVDGAADEVITTVAGNGVRAQAGDGGPATNASFVEPIGLAFDPSGGLLVVDRTEGRLRRVDPGVDGLVNGSGDEAIQSVLIGLSFPEDLGSDAARNVLIPENQARVVRRVTAVLTERWISMATTLSRS